MSSISLQKLKAIVGETIHAVIVAEMPGDMRRAFIVLGDETHVEIFVRNGGISSRAPGGVARILAFCERDGGTITTVARMEADA
jgi:hypothetical protein